MFSHTIALTLAADLMRATITIEDNDSDIVHIRQESLLLGMLHPALYQTIHAHLRSWNITSSYTDEHDCGVDSNVVPLTNMTVVLTAM